MTDSIIEQAIQIANQETEAKKQLMAMRNEYNHKVLYQIEQLLDLNPELRITQLLEDYVTKGDRYYEEPNITYSRLEQTLKSAYAKRST